MITFTCTAGSVVVYPDRGGVGHTLNAGEKLECPVVDPAFPLTKPLNEYAWEELAPYWLAPGVGHYGDSPGGVAQISVAEPMIIRQFSGFSGDIEAEDLYVDAQLTPETTREAGMVMWNVVTFTALRI